MGKREDKDIQRMFNLCLQAPASKGEVHKFDGVTPLKDFEGKNMDVASMMFAKLVAKFLKTGDVKLFETIMKYSGNEPARNENISLELPTIVNDLTPPEEKKVQLGVNFAIYDDSNESEDKE